MDQSICAAIAASIEDNIQTGEWPPGERLPAERVLAEAHGVSRNTIREAIKILVEKQVLETRMGSGTYVTTRAAEALGQILEKRTRRIKEIFEIRRLLEPQIAQLAAQRISQPTLEILAELIRAQKKAQDQGEAGIKEDMDFHRTLARATGNTVLMELYDTLSEILTESRSRALQTLERQQTSLTAHTRILSALEKKDPHLARQHMEAHMEAVKHVLNL